MAAIYKSYNKTFVNPAQFDWLVIVSYNMKVKNKC